MTDFEGNGEAGGSEDFARMLAEQSGEHSLPLRIGEKVRAKVIHVGQDNVFCALSPTQEGSIAKAELSDAEGKLTVSVGDSLDLFVIANHNGFELSKKLGRGVADIDTLLEARRSSLPVEGMVTGVNKGGLEVTIAGVRGFCPVSQIDVDFVESPAAFVGKTLQFAVKEVKDGGRNVVLSRRALLEAERAERGQKLLATLAVGQRLTAKITRVLDFGAFADLGGIEGLIPISELSFSRVEKPTDVIKAGDEVTVEVLRIEPDAKRPEKPRIALSLKATLPDPFEANLGALAEGAQLTGKVVKCEKFGAFVELFPGVQGLVHVSELSNKRVRHPSDVVAVGQEVNVRVLGVDRAERRISLSLKEAPAELAAGGPTLGVGALVEGTVDRIERFGVFVKLKGGESALLPAAESGTPPGTDLARVFPVGSTHALVVSAVDERGRLKVSKKAREAAEERATVDDFNRGQRGAGGKGFGTLGDLLKQKPRT